MVDSQLTPLLLLLLLLLITMALSHTSRPTLGRPIPTPVLRTLFVLTFFVKDCWAASCGFESSDLCSWTRVGSGSTVWDRTSGSTPNSGTGPSSAKEGSYYMFLETSGGSTGATAYLESPSLSGVFSLDVSFWYHCYGSSIGS